MGAVEDFMAGLTDLDATPTQQGTVVTYSVAAVQGARGGQQVRTAVEVAELAMWPVAPPHWIHLPEDVVLRPTNADRCGVLPGWVRHSRQIAGWGDGADPPQAWLAHVRGVLRDAVA